MKDEAEDLMSNIRSSANNVINGIGDLTAANNSLDVNCIEYRIRKSQIAKLTNHLVKLMERCDYLQNEFKPPLGSSGSRPSSNSINLAPSAFAIADEARRTRMSKSTDDLKGAFAEAAKLSRVNPFTKRNIP